MPERENHTHAGRSRSRSLEKWLVFAAGGAVILCISTAVLFVLLFSFSDAPGQWSAIVYPDKADLTKFRVTPRFSSASYCIDQAKEELRRIQAPGGGDYACGFNCGQGPDPRSMVTCERYRK